jgi:hypothetical protein
MYTATNIEWGYPDGFKEAQQQSLGAFQSCTLASVAPAHAEYEVLVLTSTTVSTKSKDLTEATNTAEADPGSEPKSSSAAAAPSTQNIAIGDQTLSVNYIEATQSYAAHPDAVATTPAIVVGTQTIIIGQTTTVNGYTVIATTAADSKPQVIVVGQSGSSTIAVPTANDSDALGGYIASGIGGTKTGSSAQYTGGAVRSESPPVTALLVSILIVLVFHT